MVVEYAIYCDTCGLPICVNRMSIRAARAYGSLYCGANHGPDGDTCLACRKAMIRKETDEMLARGPLAKPCDWPGAPKHDARVHPRSKDDA